MTRTLLALPALAFLSLAACQPVVVPPDPGEGTGDACGASGLQSLLGQPATVISAMVLTNPYRVIRPGEAVTMDFLPTRINFELDGAGRIVRIYCG